MGEWSTHFQLGLCFSGSVPLWWWACLALCPGDFWLLCWGWVCPVLLLLLVATSPWTASQLSAFAFPLTDTREVPTILYLALRCSWDAGPLLFCITSDIAEKTMDFMTRTELKKQTWYFVHCYIFFSGARKIGIFSLTYGSKKSMNCFIIFNSYFSQLKLLLLMFSFIIRIHNLMCTLNIQRKETSEFTSMAIG